MHTPLSSRIFVPVLLVGLLSAACGEATPATPSAAPASSAPASVAPPPTSSAPAPASSAPAPSVVASTAPASAAASGGAAVAAGGTSCPNGGTVRFGVESFETAPKLDAQYKPFAAALGKALGCNVEVTITTSYNAEIEAMRSGKVEVAEYGPLGYVLANKVANAQAVATFADKNNQPATYYASIVSWPGSGVTDLKGVAGRSFAYSDPASTSGHLFPAYALKKVANLDPDTGVKAIYAGSHTASFEAIKAHKVEAGEMNSDQINAATKEGSYKPADFPTLWKSDPIPQDPLTVRGDLPDTFKTQVTKALLSIDMTALPSDAQSLFNDLGQESAHLVPQTDASFNGIRDLVGILNIDLNKVNS